MKLKNKTLVFIRDIIWLPLKWIAVMSGMIILLFIYLIMLLHWFISDKSLNEIKDQWDFDEYNPVRLIRMGIK